MGAKASQRPLRDFLEKGQEEQWGLLMDTGLNIYIMNYEVNTKAGRARKRLMTPTLEAQHFYCFVVLAATASSLHAATKGLIKGSWLCDRSF